MESQRFIDRPFVRIIALAVLFLLIYLALGYVDGVIFRGIDGILCIGGFVFWLMFFAQFVLPVQRLRDRWLIFERLLIYFTGSHGPAVFIENGVVRGSEAEKKRRGPGVIWLDTASAAVLRTEVAFTRTVGPGVVFTHGGEYIYKSVDLHEQMANLGPLDTDDPYATLKAGETDEEKVKKHKETQDRRWETSAMTRDGIEVIASFIVLFSIEAEPNSNENPGTPFGYSETNVFKYIVSDATDEIIKRIVVDVWREYIRKFRFDQFFQILPGENITLLQKIGGLLNQRLKNAMIKDLDEYGRTIQNDISSREYDELKKMGVTVTPVLKRVFLPSELEQRLVSTWTTNWLKNAQKEKEQVERTRVLRVRVGQEEALKEFATNAAQEYERDDPKTQAETLELMLRGTLKGIIRNSSLQRRLTSEPNDISDIVQWVRENAGRSEDE